MAFADIVIALEDGRIREVGSPEVLLANKEHISRLGLPERYESLVIKAAENLQISKIQSMAAESIASVTESTNEANDSQDAKRKNGDWSVYSYYFSSSRYLTIILFLLSMAAWIFCTEFTSRCTKHPPQNSLGD